MSDILPSMSEGGHIETFKFSFTLDDSVSQGVKYALGENERIPEKKLEVVGLEDLVASPPFVSLNDVCYITTVSYLKRKYSRVGSWYDPNKSWKVSLVIPLPPQDPFTAPGPPLLALILSYRSPDPDEETTITINHLTLSFDRLREVNVLKREPWNPKTNFRVIEMWHLYMTMFEFNEVGTAEITVCWSKVIKKTSPPRMPLYRALFLEGVQDSLCADLSLRDIANLAATSKGFARVLRDYPTRRLRALLSDWFTDIPQFAEVLRITDAVIGGSAMLYVLCPDRNWFPGDLDIVIPQASAQGMVTFLESQSYAQVDLEQMGEPYPRPVYFQRVRFTRKNDEKQTWIDLTIMDGHRYGLRSADFITTYHSSVVMNFYNGYDLFCLFPILTFNRYNLLNYSAQEYAGRYEEKYRARGYRLLPTMRYIHRYTGGIWARSNEHYLFKMRGFPKPWTQNIFL